MIIRSAGVASKNFRNSIIATFATDSNFVPAHSCSGSKSVLCTGSNVGPLHGLKPTACIEKRRSPIGQSPSRAHINVWSGGRAVACNPRTILTQYRNQILPPSRSRVSRRITEQLRNGPAGHSLRVPAVPSECGQGTHLSRIGFALARDDESGSRQDRGGRSRGRRHGRLRDTKP